MRIGAEEMMVTWKVKFAFVSPPAAEYSLRVASAASGAGDTLPGRFPIKFVNIGGLISEFVSAPCFAVEAWTCLDALFGEVARDPDADCGKPGGSGGKLGGPCCA